jgi:hypothetical protein
MKLPLHLLLIVMMGSASAQSTLPACQGKEVSNWNNCFGFNVKNGDHMDYGFFTNSSKYVGEYKEGKPEGQGALTDNYNSDKYEGGWEASMRNGQGTYWVSEGKNKLRREYKQTNIATEYIELTFC